MRKFGVEIEFGGDRAAAARAIVAAGLGQGNGSHGYIGHSDSYWVVKQDGSVSNGGELVSPPLDFDNPAHREQVTTAINALRQAGCRTYEAAGIHVHVDTTGMDAQQVAAVARVYTKFEDVLYRIASSGWRTIRSGASTYAKPLMQTQVTAIARAKTDEQLMRAYYQERSLAECQRSAGYHGHGARYYGLNLHSWFYRKTIEFRIFNSSLNPERVQGYIAICMALVQDARNGNRRSVNKAYRLGDMDAGTATEAAALHRFLQVLRYEAGMSVEDMQRVRRIWKDSKPQRRFVSYT